MSGATQIHRAVVGALQATGALTFKKRIRTRQIANAIGQSLEDARSALKELESAGVVGKYPSKTNPRPFLIKLVRGVPTRPDFPSDALHVLGLSKRNATAARIVGNLAVQGLDMWDPQDRNTFNDLVEQLIRAGFDGKLGTYEFVAGSYHWWLILGWSRQFKNFIRQRGKRVRKGGKTAAAKSKFRRQGASP